MNAGMAATDAGASAASATNLALQRIAAEVTAGLRHGYFDVRVTCEVIGKGSRRLILHAGRSHQFLIPARECEAKSAPES
jgi:hypothetical protein